MCFLFFRSDIPQNYIHQVRDSLKQLDYQKKDNQHLRTWQDHVKCFKMAPSNWDLQNYFLIWKISLHKNQDLLQLSNDNKNI